MKVSDPPVAAALISTGLISLVPNLLLLAFPYYEHGDRGKQGMFLSLGQALAAGGLLGDVFLHTLPHAYMEDHHGGIGHGGSVGLWLLFGFALFLVVDMLVRSMHHHHQHVDLTTITKGEKKKGNNESCSHAETLKSAPLWFSSTIVLNLAADAIHNFTDGIAIGASFASSSGVVHNTDDTIWSLIASRGALTTLSVALHEIPHEIGDFSILVSRGFSKRQAILAQFGTATAALLGTLVGLVSAEFGKTDEMMYATAGGFVYLAAVQIIPELLEDDTQTWKMRLAQICTFGVGIAFMYSVALLEEHEHGHVHYHHDHHNHHEQHDLGHHHHHNHGHTDDDQHHHHAEL